MAIRDFKEALYHSKCRVCKEGLDWEANFDADGTTYHTNCCEFDYWLSPHTVEFSYEKEEMDE